MAALLLATRGFAVTLVEKSKHPGGKLREVEIGGHAIDSGPTVFTMRPVFEAIFQVAGARLDDYITLRRAEILARHSWEDGSRFDLHADREATAQAVEALAGAREAQGYRDFCHRTAEVFAALDGPFMENAAPTPLSLARSAGLAGLPALTRIQPFTSLWNVVGRYFADPRLQQLFGRYATYCGSSPFSAPGPLMLIAHVEQMGVWLVEGGMIRLAEALETLAAASGVGIHYGEDVAEVIIRNGRAAGVRLASGETLYADAVIFNGDPSALASGLLGNAVHGAVTGWTPRQRSLSALTWSISGTATGFPLSRHTVFFSRDYRREFDEIAAGSLPSEPTIYVCAQDRGADDSPLGDGPERLFLLVNAPAHADFKPLSEMEMASCETRVMERLLRAGLTISAPPERMVRTGPADFATLFPGTGGALYGRASHGWAASFQRPGARSRIAGLYLAGGAVHPGPGIPMAALSGRHSASAVMQDLASTASFHPVATSGGMSMP